MDNQSIPALFKQYPILDFSVLNFEVGLTWQELVNCLQAH